MFNALPQVMCYFHSLERTLFLGNVPEPMKKPFEVTMEAHERGLEAERPGNKLSDILRTTSSVFEKAGYAGYQSIHATGHSYGLMGPFWGREKKGEVNFVNDTVIRENMIISIEPALYIPGLGGFRHCDMVLITKDGNEVLTKFRRGVICIEK